MLKIPGYEEGCIAIDGLCTVNLLTNHILRSTLRELSVLLKIYYVEVMIYDKGAAEWNGLSGHTKFLLCGDEDHNYP